jgi:hypothetical protein
MWDVLHKLFTEATGLLASIILVVKHGEEVLETGLRWIGLRDEVERSGQERRHDMGLSQDVKLAITFIPQLEKIAADAKTAEQNPANQQLVADIQALISMIKATA